MRLLHLFVIGALVFAAAYVYRIKMDSTVRTEQVLKLHAEIREERNKIAVLRAEWARLDSPLRLQGLVERHLALTGSGCAAALLADWDAAVADFVRVIPHDYRRVLDAQSRMRAAGLPPDAAEMAAFAHNAADLARVGGA